VVNGVTGDTADLSINSATSAPGFATATVPASGTGLSPDKATTTLFSGATVNLAEQLGAANRGAYASRINCDQPGLTADADGRGGTFEVPATPVAVTCTITNTGPAPVPTVTQTARGPPCMTSR
jgi:hypothetical protein